MLNLPIEHGKLRMPNLVKWAGGKTSLIVELLPLVPKKFGTYFEPFFGGGSLFWNLKIRGRIGKAVISDLNPDLINMLIAVRDHSEDLSEELDRFRYENGKEKYYEIRDRFNDTRSNSSNSIERAAMFLYLNRNSYNGLWRVNKKGEFNVPFGHYTIYWLPSHQELRVYSEMLQDTTIVQSDFTQAIRKCKRGDFVYFDPPYYNDLDYGFTKYCGENFGIYDQMRLEETVDSLTADGALVMESNYGKDLIRLLYKDYRQIELGVYHAISCRKRSRKETMEVMIVNYDITK